MSIKISIPVQEELKPKICVFGVGGGGVNAVNNMISSNLEGVDFFAGNTDTQSLESSLASNKIKFGISLTKGLGAGSNPEVGKAAAEESASEISEALEKYNMVFITAGMGGGTGTGGIPIVAKLAKDLGILTVAVVTKPFHFEGAKRMRAAEEGLAVLQDYVDTLIVVPNQNLFRLATEKTTFADAFKLADQVLYSGVRGITDLITMPGLINLDFADIHSIIKEKGKAMMGTGEAEGDGRPVKAAEAAISNPLLDHSSMKGAKGVLINISGGMDITLFEVDEAANRIKDEVDPNANIIFGSAFDANLDGKIRVSVFATGIDHEFTKVASSPNVKSMENEVIVQPKEQTQIQKPPTQKEVVEEKSETLSDVSNAQKDKKQNLFDFEEDNKDLKKDENYLQKAQNISNDGNEDLENKKPQAASLFEIPTFLRNRKKL